jgi:glycosyltransferase involved in cell wall biosynthesis
VPADQIDLTEFPNVLYVADVPVEKSFHGSLLIYRLLQTYPPEKLNIVEGFLGSSQKTKRLPGVKYSTLESKIVRLLSTRVHSLVANWFTLSARARARCLPPILGGFVPDVVLTVAHGYSWLTAAEYAAKAKIPLCVIVHDDWPNIGKRRGWIQSWMRNRFGEVYRQAAARLTVSPNMNDEYRVRYGVRGDVLYPSQAVDAIFRNSHRYVDAGPVHTIGKSFAIAYAGTIAPAGYADLLKLVATCILGMGGKLVIYGPLTSEQARSHGLDLPNIELRGLLAPEKLQECLVADADILLLPMSFEKEDASNMRFAFPSKLADYSLTDLPILILGPAYSSAVRWAQESGLATRVVTCMDPNRIGTVIDEILNSAREMMKEAEFRSGTANTFSHYLAFEIFYGCISRCAREAGHASRQIEI